MRCPDCNKFVGLDTESDPEMDLEVDDTTGQVTGTVRIVNACADCSSELTEAIFEVDLDFEEAQEHLAGLGQSHELELSEDVVTRDARTEGKGRGTRTFYGASATFEVKCACGLAWSKEWSDEIQASCMDSLS